MRFFQLHHGLIEIPEKSISQQLVVDKTPLTSSVVITLINTYENISPVIVYLPRYFLAAESRAIPGDRIRYL